MKPLDRMLLRRAVVMGAGLAALGTPLALLAQAFPIVPPQLPPRVAGQVQQTSGASAPQPNAQPAVQPQAPYPAQGQAAGGMQGQAPRGQATAPQGYAPQGYAPPGPGPQIHAPQSTLQPAYGPQGHAPQAYVPAAPAPMPAVTMPAAPADRCRVLPSPERASLALVSGEPPLPREHVPLGEFRAQQVIHSQDGRWAVAFTKLRGAPQFAALSIDLEACRMQRSVDLPAAGSDAVFEGDQAVLRWAGGERRVALKDGSVR